MRRVLAIAIACAIGFTAVSAGAWRLTSTGTATGLAATENEVMPSEKDCSDATSQPGPSG